MHAGMIIVGTMHGSCQLEKVQDKASAVLKIESQFTW